MNLGNVDMDRDVEPLRVSVILSYRERRDVEEGEENAIVKKRVILPLPLIVSCDASIASS